MRAVTAHSEAGEGGVFAGVHGRQSVLGGTCHVASSSAFAILLSGDGRTSGVAERRGQIPGPSDSPAVHAHAVHANVAANLLEVVVMITAEGNQIAIHAMPMREKYARLLDS